MVHCVHHILRVLVRRRILCRAFRSNHRIDVSRTRLWHFIPFLDSAAEHILLQRVGGDYAFIYRTLLARNEPPEFSTDEPHIVIF